MAGAPSPGQRERIFDPDPPGVDAVEESLSPASVAGPERDAATATFPCAVFWLDLSGRVTRWSGDCCDIFGRSEAEAPEHFADLFTPRDRDAGVPTLLLRQVSETGSWEGTGIRVHGTGSTIRVGSSVSRVRTPNGLDIGFMVVTRDISRTLRQPVDPVGESAARLASLGRVASDVSHDVQSILTAIRGFAGALERHLPPSGAGHHLWHELLKACDRGTDVTRRLLGTGRPDVTEGTTSDVTEIIAEIEPLLRQVVPARISLSVSVDASVPQVRLRPSDLELVLLNLVINARDAIEGDGLITIEALCRAAEDGRPRVVLRVGDSGHGMTEEVRARCMERAFTTKERGSGSGLGLALVRSMVDQASGTIDIDSIVGAGTTMTLTLDAAEYDSVRGGVVATDDASAPLILLNTSSFGAGAVVVSLLRRQGFRVSQAKDADDLRRLEEALPQPPALIILDDETSRKRPRNEGARDERVSIDPVPVLYLRDGHGTTTTPIGHRDRELTGAFDPHEVVRAVAEMLDVNADEAKRSIH